MTPAEIIEELEQLSPADVDQEIEDLEDRITLLRRIRKMISADATKPAKERKPRSQGNPPKAGSQPPEDSGMSGAESHIRLEHYIRLNGPKTFHELMAGLKLTPGALSEAIDQARVTKRSDKTYDIES